MIRLTCPHCRFSNQIPDTAAGTVAACEMCRKAFQIPGQAVPRWGGKGTHLFSDA